MTTKLEGKARDVTKQMLEREGVYDDFLQRTNEADGTPGPARRLSDDIAAVLVAFARDHAKRTVRMHVLASVPNENKSSKVLAMQERFISDAIRAAEDAE